MSVRSPSGVSPAARVSTDLATGRLSPVSADSAISSVAASSRRPSAGTMSPASTATTSPGTSCSAGNSTSCPSRRTRALMNIIFWSAATASAALPSWWRPRTALKIVSRRTTMPVPYSCSGQMLPMPTTSRTTCIASRYWRTNARQRGSGFVSANLFGPYFAERLSTSVVPRPCAASTPSFAVVSVASREYQASTSVCWSAVTVAMTSPPLRLADGGRWSAVRVFGRARRARSRRFRRRSSR